MSRRMVGKRSSPLPRCVQLPCEAPHDGHTTATKKICTRHTVACTVTTTHCPTVDEQQRLTFTMPIGRTKRTNVSTRRTQGLLGRIKLLGRVEWKRNQSILCHEQYDSKTKNTSGRWCEMRKRHRQLLERRRRLRWLWPQTLQLWIPPRGAQQRPL
jgi:hypothetical protein